MKKEFKNYLKYSFAKCTFCVGFLFGAQAWSDEASNYKIEVWVDNWFKSYLNAKPLLEDSVSIKTERSFNAEYASFSISGDFTLAFVVKDFIENDTGLEYIGSRRQQMGDGGFIAQITDLASGNLLGVSNNKMRCLVVHQAPLDSSCARQAMPKAGEGVCQYKILEEPEGWKLHDFDDSEWPYAHEFTEAQVSPKFGYHDIQWAPSAKLIWSEDLEKDNTLLCRLKIEP